MPFLNDAVKDEGLEFLAGNSVRVDICSQEPSSITEATSTYSLGNKTLTAGSVTDAASGSGRRVQIPSFTDGNVTTSGTASHWAITDGANLVAASSLTGTQDVTSGNQFTLDEIDVIIRDP